MWRRAGLRLAGGLICIATFAAATAGPASAPLPTGPSLNPRTHGFMLYFSQPIGGGAGVGGPRFGLRLEQVRMAGNNGAPDAGNPMQHRSIIGWQFGGLRTSDMHLELGGRVTYDVRHGGFALQSSSHIPQPMRFTSNTASLSLRGAKPFDAAAVVRLHPKLPQQNERPGHRPSPRDGG